MVSLPSHDTELHVVQVAPPQEDEGDSYFSLSSFTVLHEVHWYLSLWMAVLASS